MWFAPCCRRMLKEKCLSCDGKESTFVYHQCSPVLSRRPAQHLKRASRGWGRDQHPRFAGSKRNVKVEKHFRDVTIEIILKSMYLSV